MEKKSILNQSKIVNIICSVAVQKNGKYALVKEAKKEVRNLWNFPSGKVMLNENLLDAAIRETKEETGYDCQIESIINIYYFYWDDMPGLTIRFNFLGKLTSRKKGELAKDVLGVNWLSLEEIQKLANHKKLRSKAAYQMLEDLSKNVSYPLNVIKFI
ncbi:NUDIX domain-containing protein [Patescibacteria group bacterium]|nr:NUDIX domain-containing protein [Patescibacteria group bacterium]